ncbi:MAG: type II toxin-antitoxin system VapC family toxin [Methanosarcinales archaeon Met12]|nr:MAG: type II toxin-antitoxin system VapC family toxin [Methanosarcinales archaeon Met12]
MFLKILEGNLEIRNKFLELCKDEKVFRNSIVYSEVVYVFLKLVTGKSSFELKKEPEVIKSKAQELEKVEALINIAENLPISNVIEEEARWIVQQYGLLPNDALIAATCKHYGIKKIATFDSDFKRVDFLEIIVPE